MAFSSMSIEQITFEVDDTRCNNQKIKSSDSLVHYDYSEFPNQINDYSFHDNQNDNKNQPIVSFDINNNNNDNSNPKDDENSNRPVTPPLISSNNQQSESNQLFKL